MQYSDRAQRFVDAIHDEYELATDYETLLHEIAGSITMLDYLTDALTNEPAIVTGSTRQPRPNPLIEQIRAERSLLARMIKQLGVSDVPEEPAPDNWVTRQARHAAQVRWYREKGA